MTFLDWSDTEEVLGLLEEYVRDAKQQCGNDVQRRRFLSQLLSRITKLSEDFPNKSSRKVVKGLRDIYDWIGEEYKSDPVTVHIQDCIQEFEGRKSNNQHENQRS
ncbi:MAG: hypothetical protein C5B54_03635 [Acidobacteria bacterium]|nr:MAG: hypothetical protein C5B54_03635 [Acidobacteriota bacterium]